MRVIVTGAKGFVGKRLLGELARCGHETAAIDVGDRIDALAGRWDVMYNLAWRGKGGTERADFNVQMSNVKAALDYYSAAVRLGCSRYVCPGTIGEKMVSLPECSKIKSENFVYAISKNYLHSLLSALEHESCRVVWAVLGNLYGGADSGGNIIDWTIARILAGEVARFGPAAQPYDFIHVDDAARALALLGVCENPASGEYYVGCGKPKPLGEYLLEVGRLAGRPELIGIGRRPDDGTRYRAEWFDISPLSRETGFMPEIDFSAGVGALVRGIIGGDRTDG